jgi:hypothetical protein
MVDRDGRRHFITRNNLRRAIAKLGERDLLQTRT